MLRIAFFCIPAHGHTNPTLGVVKELIARGHEVRYYSYDSMREKIAATGATYISCDNYDMQMQLNPEDSARVGKDIAFSTELLVNTTLALDKGVLQDMQAWRPDCIVADSMAAWGKLTARKLGVPLVSSTTTFAFNRYSAKVMGQGLGQLFAMLPAMHRANKSAKRLRACGYPVKNVLSIIGNDNETDTIVYTSPEFQPFSETFSEKYAFVGPSIRSAGPVAEKPSGKMLYISLGTVNNKNAAFYRNCIAAFGGMDITVLISVGERTELAALGETPPNITLAPSVDQIAVLQQTDAFLTHCGMNSVSEALYFRVPLILFPQTSEQKGVANRAAELGAGVFLRENSVEALRGAVRTVLQDPAYQAAAAQIAQGFHRCGGAKAAADKIERVAGISAGEW